MTDLMASLEAATESSRKLDEAIAFSLYPDLRRDGDRFYIDDIQVYVEDYTTSIDAALTLVPKGWGWAVAELDENKPSAVVTNREPQLKLGTFDPNPNKIDLRAEAATPALALCIAALEAKEEE